MADTSVDEPTQVVERSRVQELLEEVGVSEGVAAGVRRLGQGGVVVALSLATPVLFGIVTTALGQPFDPALGEDAVRSVAGLIWIFPALAMPVPFLVGIWHQADPVPRTVRIGAGLTPPAAMVAGLWILGVGLSGATGLAALLVGLVAVAALSTFGLPVLFPSERRSYAKIALGLVLLGIVVTLLFAVVGSGAIPGRGSGTRLIGAVLVLLGVIYTLFTAAAFVGEGLHYDPVRDERLGDRLDRLRDRIDDEFSRGNLGESTREDYLDQVAEIRDAEATARSQAVPSLRLRRHATLGTAFAILALILATVAAVVAAGSPSVDAARARALGWGATLISTHGIVLLLGSALAFAYASKRDTRRQAAVDTAWGALESCREEVLRTVRASTVEEEE